MNTTTKPRKPPHADAALIQGNGGARAVAEKLGASQQRVQNWITRGIPAAVKVQWPGMFLPNLVKKGGKQ